ncbi:MAG: 50S ribosomal protein L23 [Desulfurella sp.]|jgi:large subunit ribosomal protein L23|uniref:Large ribosomal subunit protein uL23 n=1 Tax=Desulfurella multipotens TaxID=79269 RepID=A0A1G6KFZ0_9BACT|nr:MULTISPECIES: 50S ribosomal protein L23 [Desulfurella]PMP67912.1 MAG: 50S ribosomal protein L23 [Desulfurella multipotens]PMP87077.1 MAG: 50S ribosomal protein L23 [Desulfurella sp.]SDC29874.1 large subunit ribosomal protein L23 [Desulfurella multipotens]HEX13990.1 50S ribosomal protein L23 [Desulfurella acetivorans]
MDKWDIIRGRVVSEKALMMQELNKYEFYVPVKATKPEIKKSIESIFNVKVKDVNVINSKGKVKVFRGIVGKKNSRKKCVVTLKEGYSINL